uniref:Uncharacterized protein n=1 Tax=Solanum tuberosum TaxID=4113 RepID=M1ATF9_SOLTU
MSSSFGITGGRGDLIAMQVDREQPYRGKKPFMQCTHCGLKGNLKEKCYQLIGYPADWKGKKVMANAVAVANTVAVDTNVGRSFVAQERVTPGHYYKGASHHITANYNMLKSKTEINNDQIEMSDEDDIDLDISEIQQFHGSPQRDMSESGLRNIEEQPVEHEGLTTDVITGGVACVIHLGNLESAKGTGVDLSVLKVSNSWFHSNTKAVALDSPSSLDRFTIVL